MPAWMTDTAAPRAPRSPAPRMDTAADEWVYIDINGAQQGPFSASEMRAWYAGGFFKADLQVRRRSEPQSLFCSLGDCMALRETADTSGDNAARVGVRESMGAEHTTDERVGKPPSSADGAADAEADRRGGGWQKAPLADQAMMFAKGQAQEIMAGGTAATAEGQAYFLQEQKKMLEQKLDKIDIAAQRQTGRIMTSPALAKPIGKKKVGGCGSFLAALKKQVKQAEEKDGSAQRDLTLDSSEKQGENQGVFSYLQPPMGH